MKECEHFLGFFNYPYEPVFIELKETHPIFQEIIEKYRKDKDIIWFSFCPYCGIELDKGMPK